MFIQFKSRPILIWVFCVTLICIFVECSSIKSFEQYRQKIWVDWIIIFDKKIPLDDINSNIKEIQDSIGRYAKTVGLAKSSISMNSFEIGPRCMDSTFNVRTYRLVIVVNPIGGRDPNTPHPPPCPPLIPGEHLIDNNALTKK